MNNWEPVETAPTNTDVLVFAMGRQYVAWLIDDATDPWFEEGSSESDFNGLWVVDDNKHGPYALRGGKPTHWMPLPEPPPTDA